jgi:transposase-like protein
MPYKEKPIIKKYFTIGEVAKELGVATSLIRFWETQFDFIRPKKTPRETVNTHKTISKNSS